MFLSQKPYFYDSTPYCTDVNIASVLLKLQNAVQTMPQDFADIRMKANPVKYADKLENITTKLLEKRLVKAITSSKCEKVIRSYNRS